MASKLRRRREGFTMIEMLITLVVISSLLLLVMLGSQRINQSSLRTEQAFWTSFDGYWKQALSEAEYHNRSTMVKIKTDQPVVFKTNGHENKLNLPKSLHPDKNVLLDIRANSSISPQTVTFHSDIDHRIYRLVIQMGWGVYHVDRQAA
ncbi:prepilin-type N-terminal cleavage/methylation domain-containing protein [Secundilactobacillus folii]|uniref:Prepilin-type N-terminal cleavage/methylation domain-containing protein n=1 Tax=Secundilactobacillus folii TaxID=2678357 RepID=A0A7X2XX17_9LACO|nr:prepilin-type N-terminal cleavage/methylation domain-containing protein [Secundilactobacillus folii]MTV83228.1 prepilin-type N-terminal cleavage/methylation domain-containing protein [Secundilactobacillus folii]